MNFNRDGVTRRISKLNSNKNRIAHKCVVAASFLMVIVLLLTAVFGSSLAYGSFTALINNAKSITFDDVTPTDYYTIIYDNAGRQMEKLVMSGSNREEVSLSDMPKNLINAFVAIEDERFWIHNGIDLKGIVRAGFTALTTFRLSQGASTITQQLIKNSVFNGGSERDLGSMIERKIQEQALAVQLENQLSKNIILENYLNTINLGSNCLGVQAAANRYFNKDVGELTLSECAVIAAITQNPSGYNPIRFPEKNQERQQTVLSYMKEQGYITQEEYDEAISDDVYSRIQISSSDSSSQIFSYFTDAVIDEVVTDLQVQLGYTQTQAYNMLYSGGLSIYTTMDSSIQKIVDEEINDLDNYPYEYYSITYRLKVIKADGSIVSYSESDVNSFIREQNLISNFEALFSSREEINISISYFKAYTLAADDIVDSESLIVTLQPQVSMVVMDPSTGYVRAISGGRGEKTGNLAYNRATSSTRQPGSTFKVLTTFAPALDTCGATLASTYYDSPVISDGQNFSNWWGSEYLGYVNIRDSIAYSMNLPTLHCLLETVSVDLAYQYTENFGITTLVDSQKAADGTVYTDRITSLALGGLTNGVTNLELTAAYATIANQGIYTEPVFYTKILKHDGTVLLEKEPTTRTVIKSSTASLLTLGMEATFGKNLATNYEDINPNILPTGRNFDFDGMSLAAKSGSTTDNNDVWFVGYSPYYVCGIWSGYDRGKALETGQVYHKEIWTRVMERIHENLEDIGWAENPDIVTARICTKSGLLAVDGVCNHPSSNGKVYNEYFLKGTEPTAYCGYHEKIIFCKASGKPATELCPRDNVENRVFVRLSNDLIETDYKTSELDFVFPFASGTVCDIHIPEETTKEPTPTPTPTPTSIPTKQPETMTNESSIP